MSPEVHQRFVPIVVDEAFTGLTLISEQMEPEFAWCIEDSDDGELRRFPCQTVACAALVVVELRGWGSDIPTGAGFSGTLVTARLGVRWVEK